MIVSLSLLNTGCSKHPTKPDYHISPTISIVYPYQCTVFKRGQDINIIVDVKVISEDQSNQIEKVNYYLNGAYCGNITVWPYSAQFHANHTGTWKIMAQAVGKNGLSANSDTLTVIVQNGSSNEPPVEPGNLSPMLNSHVYVNRPVLRWGGYDQNSDCLTYDVYLSKNHVPGLTDMISEHQRQNYMILPDTLQSNYEQGYERYYWRVVAHDVEYEQTSQVNYFDYHPGHLSPELITVEGGTFTMGERPPVIYYDTQLHNVRLSSFQIGKYEVSNAEYGFVMGVNYPYGKDSSPATEVSWYDAVYYCNALSLNSGLEPCYDLTDIENIKCNFQANGYRLPTEAEWEYAARERNDYSLTYSGSNDIETVAWYYYNSGHYSHEVGSKEPNSLGIYDMSGNAYEWCWDYYKDMYYAECNLSGTVTNPTGPISGETRTIRGGDYNTSEFGCRIYARGRTYPSEQYGFRICRSIIR
ncbi:MAG TPA: formylglycine-generating enzyme family protein [Candidatus Cloacimonadota bacterium]|nr:formylglycine-generating enzyme family protein [Candidatus Cloacimonadota bacterium]HPT71146.1 formylglycine-generating enzyme family protein [Candidatus Cloacimonadota bacterium]